tara:strand:- start:1263 stop:1967 length:705 start_codon:yes stop_codon:yes gene_type:complete
LSNLTDIETLLKTYRKFPFTVQFHESICDLGMANISLQLFGLTRAPLHKISKGDDEILSIPHWIDVYELLQEDAKPYKSDGGWINSVFTPTMRSLFCHSLAYGEYMDQKEYCYAEYLLEYYFLFRKLFPRLDTFKKDIKIDMNIKSRKLMLSHFHMQKTSELHKARGMNAVYWMNYINDEMNNPVKVKGISALEHAMNAIMAVRTEARFLRESLDTEEKMKLLKHKMLSLGIKK